LIRLHSEKIKPPRALWVPFELGRPLGIPNDPAFQRRILLATLQLFEAPSGPVLEDYPEDAPIAEGEVSPRGSLIRGSLNDLTRADTYELKLKFMAY